MKPPSVLILLALFLHQAASAQVTVAPYYQGKSGAVSFTFDDGPSSVYDKAFPMLQAAGFKATFFVISGFTRESRMEPLNPAIPPGENWAVTTWPELREMADSGHEIGSHTETHPHLSTLGMVRLGDEIINPIQTISEKTGQTPLSVGVPFGDYNDAVLRELQYVYPAVRTGGTGFGEGMINDADGMNGFVGAAVSNGTWKVAVIHGIGEPWAPLDSAAFHDHLLYCRQLSDEGQLWVGTYIDVHLYITERSQLEILDFSSAGQQAVFTPQTGLDTSIYSHPLSFLIESGEFPLQASAVLEATGMPLPASVHGSVIRVEAPPGRGPVRVNWGEQRIRASGRDSFLPGAPPFFRPFGAMMVLEVGGDLRLISGSFSLPK